jgi:hypothetical protein
MPIMRALLVAAIAHGVLAPRVAHGEPLPPAVFELIPGGVSSGAGADAKTLGVGYIFGAEAAWQPMSTERRWGWTLRLATLFGRLWNGSAEQVNPPLLTVQMDATFGVRFRPWATPSRYLTARGGVGLLRTNDPVDGERAFVGAVGAVGFDQYIGAVVFGADLRAGLLDNGPEQLQFVLRIGLAGP